MDELKIAAAIIYAAMIEKGLTTAREINQDQSKSASDYWKIYEALKKAPEHPVS
ncbi:MAG: hypothetical protein H8D67_14760 [Deltaproteobacteria bacterium]|nr:hypothetical protein [Deltaproteobacteria bacterium]